MRSLLIRSIHTQKNNGWVGNTSALVDFLQQLLQLGHWLHLLVHVQQLKQSKIARSTSHQQKHNGSNKNGFTTFVNESTDTIWYSMTNCAYFHGKTSLST
jgi:hypothetical protein